jgi:ATP-binding cassette, subfamily B, multidrug efflux pump
MYKLFDSFIDGLRQPPNHPPPSNLLGFYWYFASQVKWVLLALIISSIAVALLETTVPLFIGQLVGILSATPKDQLLEKSWPTLAYMAFVIAIARPLAQILQRLIVNQSILPPFNTLIRWQSHWHVVRQSIGFFQSDFAGRIANRVMQVGQGVRETIIALIRSVLHILVYGLGTIGILLAQDWRLAAPIMVWFVLYITLLVWMIPRQREASRYASEKRSALTGRVVDSYTNILTLKLFAKVRDEDKHVRESFSELDAAFASQMRLSTSFIAWLTVLNAALLLVSGVVSILLWQQGAVDIATLAMALPLTSQILAMSGWVAYEVQGIFENIGLVQESMMSIAKPLQMQDSVDAKPLLITNGIIAFENVNFSYGRLTKSATNNVFPTASGLAPSQLAKGECPQSPKLNKLLMRGIHDFDESKFMAASIINDFSLTIKKGEKIGLVGRSGAGKTTLTSLLLRFHDVEGGCIKIDGQDIQTLTQESLRGAISVVTQDTSLLHRSIRENIIYGRRNASDDAMIEAAKKAQAHEFIIALEDSFGRKGYDAHVGERGVKLSGGQRQRIAIARVILKDAPILVLDEATSALDSEIEAAIQESLSSLMEGKTVIAIAHRLSTLQIMDRLIVLDKGQIAQQGTHNSLLESGGLYADLWARQSGGFLADQKI